MGHTKKIEVYHRIFLINYGNLLAIFLCTSSTAYFWPGFMAFEIIDWGIFADIGALREQTEAALSL